MIYRPRPYWRLKHSQVPDEGAHPADASVVVCHMRHVEHRVLPSRGLGGIQYRPILVGELGSGVEGFVVFDHFSEVDVWPVGPVSPTVSRPDSH